VVALVGGEEVVVGLADLQLDRLAADVVAAGVRVGRCAAEESQSSADAPCP
jgi:hypothetical protein